MKPYEILIYAVVVGMIYGGFVLRDAEIPHGHLIGFGAAGITATAYVILIKIRPLLQAKHVFLGVAAQNDFRPLAEKAHRQFATWVLRQFPGFDDVVLQVDELHGLETEGGIFLVGRYLLSGQGLNFGFFMVAIFRTSACFESLTLDKILDRREELSFAAETTLRRMPLEVEAAIREIACDFHMRDHWALADFDTRHVSMSTFRGSFDRVIKALVSLAPA